MSADNASLETGPKQAETPVKKRFFANPFKRNETNPPSTDQTQSRLRNLRDQFKHMMPGYKTPPQEEPEPSTTALPEEPQEEQKPEVLLPTYSTIEQQKIVAETGLVRGVEIKQVEDLLSKKPIVVLSSDVGGGKTSALKEMETYFSREGRQIYKLDGHMFSFFLNRDKKGAVENTAQTIQAFHQWIDTLQEVPHGQKPLVLFDSGDYLFGHTGLEGYGLQSYNELREAGSDREKIIVILSQVRDREIAIDKNVMDEANAMAEQYPHSKEVFLDRARSSMERIDTTNNNFNESLEKAIENIPLDIRIKDLQVEMMRKMATAAQDGKLNIIITDHEYRKREGYYNGPHIGDREQVYLDTIKSPETSFVYELEPTYTPAGAQLLIHRISPTISDDLTATIEETTARRHIVLKKFEEMCGIYPDFLSKLQQSDPEKQRTFLGEFAKTKPEQTPAEVRRFLSSEQYKISYSKYIKIQE